MPINHPHSLIQLVGEPPESGVDDSPLEHASAILQSRGTTYRSVGTAALSIKSFFGGPAWYDINGSTCKVTRDRYLVLNADQPYTIEKNHHKPVESFVVFFRHGMASEVNRSIATSTEDLIDDPTLRPDGAINFFEHTYPQTDRVGQALLRLRSGFRANLDESGWIEEQLYALLGSLVAEHRRSWIELDALQSVRASTRDELCRRLHRAREFIVATLEQPFSLTRVADAACLSRNHLIRTFKQLFGCTPHQFLEDQRLKRAQELLRGRKHSVYEVCTLLGYKSFGSFSHRFKQHIGCPPSKFAAHN